MKRRLFCAALCTAVSSCAVLSDQWTVETEEEGERGPQPVRHDEAIRKYLADTLKDPYSAQVREISEPRISTYFARSIVLSAPSLMDVNGRVRRYMRRAWVVNCEVNAKNSYGAYTGWHNYIFYFQGETLLHGSDVTAMNEDASNTVQRYLSR